VTRGGTEGEDKVKDVAMTEEGNGSGPSQEVGGKVEQTMNQTTTPPMNTNTNTNNQAANTTEDPNYEGASAEAAALQISDQLQLQSLPIRQYLETTVVTLLVNGLTHLVKTRPDDPVEFLAAYLLKNNPKKKT